MPTTVSVLSVAVPRFSALMMPRIEPKTVESTSATAASSSVAGRRRANRSEIGTPPVRV